eukprot:6249836-Pyramimonas_sp.AAC.1
MICTSRSHYSGDFGRVGDPRRSELGGESTVAEAGGEVEEEQGGALGEVGEPCRSLDESGAALAAHWGQVFKHVPEDETLWGEVAQLIPKIADCDVQPTYLLDQNTLMDLMLG